MNLNPIRTALLMSILTVATLPTYAQQKLVAAQSELGFTAKQMGVAMLGSFKKFDAQINFDAAKLATSKVAFTVDIASATMGSREVDAELPKAPWFNTAKFPQAQFTSTAIKSLGGAQYEVAGKLLIKGQSRDVTVPVSFAQSGAVTVVSGVLPIKRLAFNIGDGDWADTSMVADEVQIRFKLSLSGIAKF
jgi:polyisoprenoid-binding protein YceI